MPVHHPEHIMIAVSGQRTSGESQPPARSDIRGTTFGRDEMVEMCGKMGGILSAGAQQYLDEVDAAVARGEVYIIAAMANCPFEPLYRARRPPNLAGVRRIRKQRISCLSESDFGSSLK